MKNKTKKILFLLLVGIVHVSCYTSKTQNTVNALPLHDFTLINSSEKGYSIYLDNGKNQLVTKIIHDELEDFNIKKIGHYFYEHCVLFMSNAEGSIIAGAVSDISRNSQIGDLCILHALWVHPEYRHQGIGTTIINKLLEHIHSKNCNVVQVEVNEFLEHAKAFFDSCGFTTTTIIPSPQAIPGFETYVMRKNLSNQHELQVNTITKNINYNLQVHLQETANENSLQIRNNLDALKALSAQIKNMHNFSLLAFSANNTIIAGAIGVIISSEYATYCTLDRLLVQAAWRGQLVGSAMINTAIEYAKSKNCHFIQLETYEWQAKGFYEKQGFSVVGTVPNVEGYSGGEYYFMRKLLYDNEGDL